ncbi:uncharacterized protein LOC119091404 [Pollicipes pollicipes]|uniref:uncharacterized protein LOC119091404 n=1 Tax=Pollicipes pollicipes TaxID=41117 RepID=UPI0018850203|nr:uncharacterized protein LOC119091404 [Pollicipes pollicipes]
MASLVRPAVLLLVLAALCEARRGGRRRLGENNGMGMEGKGMDFDLEAVGCVPDDFNAFDMSACNATSQAAGTGMKGLLQCLAESLNLVDDQGLSDSGRDELLDSLSDDEQWQEEQRQHLELCEEMMSANLTVEQQGVYIMACWYSLSTFECKRSKMEELGASVDAENGGDVGQALVFMAEGRCLKGLMSRDSKEAFKTCKGEVGLDFGVLKDGFEYAASYLSAIQSGDNNVGPPSADSVDAVNNQLELMTQAINCTMQALGEADGNEVNFDTMRANLDAIEAPEWMKRTGQAILDECAGQEDTSVTGVLTCWHMSAAYACSSVKAHGLALMEPGQRPGRGGGRRRGGRRGGRGRGGGRNGRRRGGNGGGRNNRRRNRNQG